MPRRTRIISSKVTVQIIQFRNNLEKFFKQYYYFSLEYLAVYAKQIGCQIQAYVLITNHVHLLITAKTADGAGALMKALK